MLAARGVAAHPAPFSYLDLHVRDAAVEGSLTLHVIDVAHDLGIASPSELLDAAAAQREHARIIDLMTSRLSLRSSGESLSLDWGRIDPAPDRDAVRLVFGVRGTVSGSLSV